MSWRPDVGNSYEIATSFGMDVAIWSLDAHSGRLSMSRINSGSVRRDITCMLYSSDSQWLFAGTASGDVVTINAPRRAVQVRRIVLEIRLSLTILALVISSMRGSRDRLFRKFIDGIPWSRSPRGCTNETRASLLGFN